MKKYFSFAVALFITTATFSQVAVADFTASALSICAGDSITFTDNSIGGSISVWDWTFDTGLPAMVSGQGPQTVVFNTPGTHNINLTITDTSGIDDTTMAITVTNCISAGFIASSDTICAGDTITFTDTSITAVPLTIWNWNFDNTSGGGVIPATQFTQGPHQVQFTSAGTYEVQLIISDGIEVDTAVQSIVVTDCTPVANFTVNGTMPLCENLCITFNDLSTNTPTDYLWSFPGGTPSTSTNANPGNICYDSAGVYNVSLMVTNQYGSHQLEKPNVVNIINCDPALAGILRNADSSLCVGECLTFSYNDTLLGVPDTLIWTFQGNTNDTITTTNHQAVFERCWFDTTGEFFVSVSAKNTHNNNVYSIAYDTINVYPNPLIFAGSDQIVDFNSDSHVRAEVRNESGHILSSAGGTIEWSPSTFLSTPDELGSDLNQITDSVNYTITYIDRHGCIATDDLTVNVNFVFHIDVPSAFTPYSSTNNRLYVKGKIAIESMDFSVYNRYGQKVFETNDVDVGWDGTNNGKELNPGVFVYYVKVTYVDGSAGELKGNVTLIK